jgi:hypothetical protein
MSTAASSVGLGYEEIKPFKAILHKEDESTTFEATIGSMSPPVSAAPFNPNRLNNIRAVFMRNPEDGYTLLTGILDGLKRVAAELRQ